MSDITTYLNNNAHTPLGRFVVYTTNFAANTVTNWTDGAYALVYRSYRRPSKVRTAQWSVVGHILIPASSERAVTKFFLSPQCCADKNGSREQNHTPFRGDLSSCWQDLILSRSLCKKFESSIASAIPEIWMGHQIAYIIWSRTVAYGNTFPSYLDKLIIN